MRHRFARITVRQSCLRWIVATFILFFLMLMMPGIIHAVSYSYIYWGMASSVNCTSWASDPHHIPGYASCWHNDEGSVDAYGKSARYSAIDYTNAGGGTVGTLVQLWYAGVSLRPRFRSLVNTRCTGVRVDTYNASGTYMGDIHYLHIDVYPGVIGSNWQNRGQGYYWRDLGTVSSGQPFGCPWAGAHLHQSANTAGWTSIYSNWSVNPTNTWQHYAQQ